MPPVLFRQTCLQTSWLATTEWWRLAATGECAGSPAVSFCGRRRLLSCARCDGNPLHLLPPHLPLPNLSSPPLHSLRICSLFHEIINALLELRSLQSGTSLDKQQWEALQQHLEAAAAADAAAAAEAAAGSVDGGGGGGVASPPRSGGHSQTASFGLPGLDVQLPGRARHSRGGGGGGLGIAGHHRTGSIAASMRVGHIPAGSTDAGGCADVRLRIDV